MSFPKTKKKVTWETERAARFGLVFFFKNVFLVSVGWMVMVLETRAGTPGGVGGGGVFGKENVGLFGRDAVEEIWVVK